MSNIVVFMSNIAVQNNLYFIFCDFKSLKNIQQREKCILKS